MATFLSEDEFFEELFTNNDSNDEDFDEDQDIDSSDSSDSNGEFGESIDMISDTNTVFDDQLDMFQLPEIYNSSNSSGRQSPEAEFIPISCDNISMSMPAPRGYGLRSRTTCDGQVPPQPPSTSPTQTEATSVIQRGGKARGSGRGRGQTSGRGRGQTSGRGRGQTSGRGRGQTVGRGRGRGRGRGQRCNSSKEPKDTDVVWKDDKGEVPDWLPKLACTTPGAPSIDCTDFKPVDFFLSTFPLEVIRLIRDETNRYFDQWWQEKEGDEERTAADEEMKKDWVPTTDIEIRAFLALMIVIGNNKRPRYKSYWSTEWLISMEGFRSVMSRDRFMSILRFLHISDNSRAIPRGEDGYDRCFKIRAMLDILIPRWQSVFHMDKCTSVDECMIGFKGRIYMKQYMPKKPTKWGLKAWVLAGSTSGFVYNWKLYAGKEGDVAEANLGEKVVLNLTQVLPPGHEVYCDNYFTCFELLRALQAKGIACCGTVKSNRTSNPQEVKDFTVKKQGKAALRDMPPTFKRCNDILAVAWFDKRPVTMLSSIHSSDMIEKRVRDGDSETGYHVIEKPQAVEKYNHNMGGVDLNDQLNSYNNMVRKSLKWWEKKFFHLLVTSLSNAYIMYKLLVPKKSRLEGQKFRLQVAKGLLEGWERRTSLPGRPSLGQNPSRMVGRHFIEKMEGGRKDCVVCTKRENGKYVRRSQTQYQCKTCIPNVSLCCQPPCFELFHTKQNYKEAYEHLL